MLTDKHILKLDPAKRFKMGTNAIPLNNIDGMDISSGPESVVVLRMAKGGDIPLYFMPQTVVSELLAYLIQFMYRSVRQHGLLTTSFTNCIQYKKILKVEVVNDITYNHGSNKRLVVVHSPEVDGPRLVRTFG